jgi:hypothetical protein
MNLLGNLEKLSPECAAPSECAADHVRRGTISAVNRGFHLAVIVLLVAGLSARVRAGDKEYHRGILTDLRRYDTGSGALRSQGAFCLAVGVDDMTYLVRQEGSWRWSYAPTDLVVGDPVEVRISGNNLYLRKPTSGELKTHISRRERQRSDKNPISCATQVQGRD